MIGMFFLVLALGVFALGGIASLAASRSPRIATAFGVCGAIFGSLLGLIPTVTILMGGGSPQSLSLQIPWNVPYGSLFVQLDPLSAFFLLPILILPAISSIYGAEYLFPYRHKKLLGPPWFFYNLLIAAMTTLVIARNAILFLMAWEIMTLSAFFLVTFEHEKQDAQEAGWFYLVASHLGAAFLLALFVILGQHSGSMDFDSFASAGHAGKLKDAASLLFVFAVIGFGTKAGFMPMHVWLPEAHPAAPSHVSAVMSGVLIKTGIYGILRTLTFLGPPQAWWGTMLLVIGAVSGILAILFALSQHDLKRLLAYSSVENIGIITMGLGLGILGLHYSSPPVAVMAFAGALFHLLNHSAIKGLLFLAAGSVLHGTGTRNMQMLGGLVKRMPWTAFAFIMGAAAICGLPPLNGFASEFLIYFGAFKAVTVLGVSASVPAVIVVAALALIGGLAAACFAKAAGTVFLGQPRTEVAEHAHEAGLAMRFSLILLTVLCIFIGMSSPWIVSALAPVVTQVTGLSQSIVYDNMAVPQASLTMVVASSLGFVLLLAALALFRRWLLAGRTIAEAGTWDCGYAKPTPRIQYTPSSFTQPLTDFFKSFLRPRRNFSPPVDFFPQGASLSTQMPDLATEKAYRPIFHGIHRGLSSFRWMQHGKVQIYILYIAAVLLILLVWKLF